MPRRGGYGLAAEVAQGIDAFTRNFFQAKALKQHEKDQKNAIVVELLMNQLRGDNTPYYERARIIDQIPSLIGAKLDRPLSNIIGYDKLNEQDFVVQHGEEMTPSKQGTSAKQLVDESVSDPSMASSVNLRGTEATSEVPSTPDVTTKYGNLSPAQIKLQRDLEAQRLQNQNDVDKQAQLLKINYQLQADILGKNGYSKEVFRGFDEDGNYKITMINSSGDKKEINLGKVTSEAVRKAMITASGKSGGGKLAQLTTAQQIVSAFEADPTSVPQANYLAAKGLLDDFEKTGQVKDAQVTALTQGATGTKPLSPAQTTNNFQEDQRTQLALQSTLDNIESDLLSAEENATVSQADANNHWNAIIQPTKDAMKQWLDEGGEKTDKEYVDLNRQLNIETSKYEALKARANAAKTRFSGLQKRRDAAEKRLKSFRPSTGAATSNNFSSVDDEVGQYKNLIDAFKTSNASNPKAANLSDRQILKILKDAKRIP